MPTIHQWLSVEDTYPRSCILGSPLKLSNFCDCDKKFLVAIFLFLSLQSQLLRHLQSSVTTALLFNLHFMSHYSRVLNFPFLLSSDQSTSNKNGTCVVQLLYSNLLHNIFTFFRSYKHTKQVTPNFHVSSKKKKKLLTIQRSTPHMFSSFFSPSKYKTASNIKARRSSTASWWPKFSQESLNKHLGPEEKGYYNGM